MKILLLGKNGQVGWELQRSLIPLGEIIALDAGTKDYCGDLTDLRGLANTVHALRPAVIVNAAAYTAVDKAESEPELANTVNALAPGVLAEAAKHCGAWLVQYSTDYVFDGSGLHYRKEEDATAPLSVYGTTKLEGEKAIRASGCHHLIFRASWVYAVRGANFAKTMLRLAQERESLAVVDDQVGAPTGAELIADVTAHALRTALMEPKLGGVYHLAAAGETSWFEYARFVFECARGLGVKLIVQPEQITSIPSTAYPLPAQRPLNSRLDTSRLRHAFGLSLPDWKIGVRRMVSEMQGVQ